MFTIIRFNSSGTKVKNNVPELNRLGSTEHKIFPNLFSLSY
jgi:hypothetical protein